MINIDLICPAMNYYIPSEATGEMIKVRQEVAEAVILMRFKAGWPLDLFSDKTMTV